MARECWRIFVCGWWGYRTQQGSHHLGFVTSTRQHLPSNTSMSMQNCADAELCECTISQLCKCSIQNTSHSSLFGAIDIMQWHGCISSAFLSVFLCRHKWVKHLRNCTNAFKLFWHWRFLMQEQNEQRPWSRGVAQHIWAKGHFRVLHFMSPVLGFVIWTIHEAVYFAVWKIRVKDIFQLIFSRIKAFHCVVFFGCFKCNKKVAPPVTISSAQTQTHTTGAFVRFHFQEIFVNAMDYCAFAQLQVPIAIACVSVSYEAGSIQSITLWDGAKISSSRFLSAPGFKQETSIAEKLSLSQSVAMPWHTC